MFSEELAMVCVLTPGPSTFVIAYALTRGLIMLDNVTAILLFIEFLAANPISHRVIMNYISALKFMFCF